MKVSEEALRARLRAVYPADKLTRIEALVEERRESVPSRRGRS